MEFKTRLLQEGRPEDPGRPARETAVYDLLEELAIPYYRLDHSPAMTIADCIEAEALLGVEICKNLFLCNRQKTRFYLLVMPGRKAFHTRVLSSQIGRARLGVTPGSVSILALMNDPEHRVQLLVDREVLESPWFGCHPCLNTSSLKIRTRDVFETFLAHTGHRMVPVTLTDDPSSF